MIEGMIWQDFVMTFAFAGAIIMLYPTLKNKDSQVPRTTSGLYTPLYFMSSYTYTTLGINMSAVLFFILSFMWLGIFVFRPVKGGEE